MQSVSGLNRNSEFYFPEILNDPRGEVAGNTQVKGKQNSLFPEEPVIKCYMFRVEPVIKCFVIPLTCLTLAGTQTCCGFKVHDLL